VLKSVFTSRWSVADVVEIEIEIEIETETETETETEWRALLRPETDETGTDATGRPCGAYACQ